MPRRGEKSLRAPVHMLGERFCFVGDGLKGKYLGCCGIFVLVAESQEERKGKERIFGRVKSRRVSWVKKKGKESIIDVGHYI